MIFKRSFLARQNTRFLYLGYLIFRRQIKTKQIYTYTFSTIINVRTNPNIIDNKKVSDALNIHRGFGIGKTGSYKETVKQIKEANLLLERTDEYQSILKLDQILSISFLLLPNVNNKSVSGDLKSQELTRQRVN